MIKRVYTDYIQDILDSINDIESFIKGLDIEGFKKDRKTVNADLEILWKVASEEILKIRPGIQEILKNLPRSIHF